MSGPWWDNPLWRFGLNTAPTSDLRFILNHQNPPREVAQYVAQLLLERTDPYVKK